MKTIICANILRMLYGVFLILIMFSCSQNKQPSNSSPNIPSQKNLLGLDTAKLKANIKSNTFYAICLEEHSGWCSGPFSSYGEAQDTLASHRAKSGHTDNTVSNDCPFSGVKDYSAISIDQIKKIITPTSLDKFSKLEKNSINPIASNQIAINPSFLNSKHSVRLFGGGNEIPTSGSKVILGGSTAGTTVTVNVSGNASIRIGMNFTLSSIDAGQWVVSGPGASTFQLNCNGIYSSGCSIWFGQPVTINAQGVNGKYPVWVSFN